MSADTDYSVLRQILTHHAPFGWAIEFGVYTGYSTQIIAEHMPVIGLDCFTGLPEDWRPGFPKGKFADRKVLTKVSRFNSLIVPGLFEDTLPALTERGLPDIGLVHIDCDLYSSTVTALNGIRKFLQVGTYVVFDEFHGYEGAEDHEQRAWEEFCADEKIITELVGAGEQEKAFRITATPRPVYR